MVSATDLAALSERVDRAKAELAVERSKLESAQERRDGAQAAIEALGFSSAEEAQAEADRLAEKADEYVREIEELLDQVEGTQ